MLQSLKDKFPQTGNRLRDRFPAEEIKRLKDTFPSVQKSRGCGSGFIDKISVHIAEPVYQPPVPSFDVRYGPQTFPYSINTYPGVTIPFTGFGPFVLTNKTDDTTYTSLTWTVKNIETDTYLPQGVNQTYVINPDTNPSGVQTWEVELTAYYNGLSGKAFLTIESYPGSLNGYISDYSTHIVAVVGDVIPFSFTNTTGGPFDSVSFSSVGISLSGTGNTRTGTIVVDFANIQQPFTVTCILYGPDSNELERITQTTTFTVLPRAVARLNGNNNNFTTTTTAEEGSEVVLSFVNDSVGTYDSFEWETTPGFTLDGTGATVSGTVLLGFPDTRPLVAVTLKLFRNLVEVDRVTQTIHFVITPKYGRSIFQIVGATPPGKFTDSGVIDTFIQYTGPVILYGYPYYFEDDFSDFLYTRPSFATSTFFVNGPDGQTVYPLSQATAQLSFVPTFLPGTTSSVYNFQWKAFDSNGIQNSQCWLNVLFSLGLPIASLNGNVANYTSSSSAIGGTSRTFSFENTSQVFARVEWSSTGITLSGTGNTRTGTIVVDSSLPISFTVTLRVFITDVTLLGSVTCTTTVSPLLDKSLFDLFGYRTGSKTPNPPASLPVYTNGFSAYRLYSYPYYPEDGPFYDYYYTRPSFVKRLWDISSLITGSSSILSTTTSDLPLNVTFPNNEASDTIDIVMTTFDANDVANGHSYLRAVFINTPTPVVSLDGNVTSYTTTYVGTAGANIFTFTNTTTNQTIHTQAIWSSTGITLSGTGDTRTGTIILSENGSATFTVTLLVQNIYGYSFGTVTRTTNVVSSNPANNQIILTNAVSMLDMTPSPQSNVTSYSGIHVRWIPTASTAPSIEPTAFKIQTIATSPVTATFNLYHGNNASASRFSMSVDGALDIPRSELYTLSGDSRTISENMTWQIDYLGTQTFTNSYANTAVSLVFNQAANSVRYFDSMEMSVRTGTTKTYVTAYSCYFSNSQGIPTNTILADGGYFSTSESRYIANTNGLASVTFQLPTGNRFVAVLSGGVRVNNTLNLYGHIHTGFQASLFNVTPYVNGSRQITFGKASGAQGSIMGFFILNV